LAKAEAESKNGLTQTRHNCWQCVRLLQLLTSLGPFRSTSIFLSNILTPSTIGAIFQSLTSVLSSHSQSPGTTNTDTVNLTLAATKVFVHGHLGHLVKVAYVDFKCGHHDSAFHSRDQTGSGTVNQPSNKRLRCDATSVASAKFSRVVGTVGTYLNIRSASTRCPCSLTPPPPNVRQP
jgi:hypothetical protein